MRGEGVIDKKETLRTVLICGTIGRIKELIQIYESGKNDAISIFEQIQKTIDYANEIYKTMHEKEEE